MSEAVLEVAIVGAGFGGLAMARALDRAGIDAFRILEKDARPGGTWRDNRYPGAACDVPSHLYSLSDAPNPDWSRIFPQQPEILDYLDRLAAPFLERGRIQHGFALARARWDADAGLWLLEAGDGRRQRARTLVLALGGLHRPAWPDVPGLGDFQGTSFHSARWRHDVALDGKRVGVIGTGASAVQIVPAIAHHVRELKVLQRTPAWILPRPDRAIPSWLRRAFRRVPGLRLAFRGAIFLGLEVLSSGLLYPRSALWARLLAERHLGRQVPDPALRARLRPDYPIGCKRVLLSSDFYPALSLPQTELVDTPIRRIEREGIRLADGRLLELDVIIHATGFRPMDVLSEVDIEGRDGHRLRDDWAVRPHAHLGIGVHGYPNLFFLLGPNTALGHNSVLYMIESQVRHVMAALRERERRGVRGIEPHAEAQFEFIRRLDERFPGTAWAGGCRSWYLDAAGRNIALWVGSARAYRSLAGRLRPGEFIFG
jgi:cation diffusion facilitator CzcD-associated flavoprotein CzcO